MTRYQPPLCWGLIYTLRWTAGRGHISSESLVGSYYASLIRHFGLRLNFIHLSVQSFAWTSYSFSVPVYPTLINSSTLKSYLGLSHLTHIPRNLGRSSIPHRLSSSVIPTSGSPATILGIGYDNEVIIKTPTHSSRQIRIVLNPWIVCPCSIDLER
jgi:hypothetical protein